MSNRPPLPAVDERTGMAPLLSVDDVAKVLGVSTRSVVRLSDAGRIRFAKIGSFRRFTADAVRDFIATSEAGAVGK